MLSCLVNYCINIASNYAREYARQVVRKKAKNICKKSSQILNINVCKRSRNQLCEKRQKESKELGMKVCNKVLKTCSKGLCKKFCKKIRWKTLKQAQKMQGMWMKACNKIVRYTARRYAGKEASNQERKYAEKCQGAREEK